MRTFTLKICCLTSFLFLLIGTAKNGFGQTFSQWSGTVPTANNSYTFGATGSYSNPYLISTAADLAQLAANVNAGNTYRGMYFKQTVDIDLNNMEWIPIGGDSSSNISFLFAGNYDGDNHTIKNLKISTNYPYGAGLFGRIVADTIKNIILDSVNIVSVATDCSGQANHYWGVGAAIGSADSCLIEYIQVQSGSITHPVSSSYHYLGGIVGSLARYSISVVRYCTNGANLSTSKDMYSRAAGIVGSGGTKNNGEGPSTITGCVNIGTISGVSLMGGITTTQSPMVTNCLNAGIIISTRGNGASGISSSSAVTNCLNVNSAINHYDTITSYPIGSGSGGSNNYYDMQMQGSKTTVAGGTTGKLRSELTGTALQGTFDTNWTFSDGLYPVPTQVAHTDVAKVAACPVYLYGASTPFDTICNVASLFSWSDTSLNNTPVVWTNAKTDSNTAVFKQNSYLGKISLLKKGSDTLSCTLNSAKKEVWISTNPIEIWTADDWKELCDSVNVGGNNGFTYLEGGVGATIAVPIHFHAEEQQIIVKADIDFRGQTLLPLGNGNYVNYVNYGINYFGGIIEGNGHTFTGCSFVGSSTTPIGLVGESGGNTYIQDLHLVDFSAKSSLSSTRTIGVFVGEAYEGTTNILNCTASGEVQGLYYAGGIVGRTAANAIIKNCCFTGTIEGWQCGGITNIDAICSNTPIGDYWGRYYDSIIIENNLSSAFITSNPPYTGAQYAAYVDRGILGTASGCGIVRNNLFVGQVILTGLTDYNQPGSVALASHNYYEKQLSPLDTNRVEVVGTGLLGHRLIGDPEDAFCNLDTNFWTFTDGLYPVPTAIKDRDAAKLARTPVLQFINSDAFKQPLSGYSNDSARPIADIQYYQRYDFAKAPVRFNKNDSVTWTFPASAFVMDSATYYLCDIPRSTTDSTYYMKGSLGEATRTVALRVSAAQEVRSGEVAATMNTGLDVVLYQGGQITDASSSLALGSGKTMQYVRTFPIKPTSGLPNGANYTTMVLPFELATISVDDYDAMVRYIIRPSGKSIDEPTFESQDIPGHFQMKVLRTCEVNLDSNAMVEDTFRLRWDNHIYGKIKRPGTIVLNSEGENLLHKAYENVNDTTLISLKGVPLHIRFDDSYYANRPIRFHSVAGTAINTEFKKAKQSLDGYPLTRYFFYPNATMKNQTLGIDEPAFIWDPTTGYFEWMTPASGTAHSIPALECYIQATSRWATGPEYE